MHRRYSDLHVWERQDGQGGQSQGAKVTGEGMPGWPRTRTEGIPICTFGCTELHRGVIIASCYLVVIFTLVFFFPLDPLRTYYEINKMLSMNLNANISLS